MRKLIAAIMLAFGGLALGGPAQAQAPAQTPTQPPLRCAVDGTFAPHAMPRLGGGVEGFQIDLFREVARRMGREITIDSASFSGLIPALNAGRYDFLCAPTTVTPERAEALLFTEGYIWTELQFGIRRGSPPINSEADLRGRTISVNKGTPYEQWVTRNAERLGLTVLNFDTQPDAVQAVLNGRAQANLSGNTVIRYAASRNPQFVASYTLRETRLHWGTPFRRDSAALRETVENVIECMKRDGFVARLVTQWFGYTPEADDAAVTIFPGTGVPGLSGYDPTPREPRCS